MAENDTSQEELELTPEQKKVLGQVYRLILSWDCETPAVSTNEAEDDEKTPEVSASAKVISEIVTPQKTELCNSFK